MILDEYNSESEKAWRAEYMKRTHLCDSSSDPVQNMVSRRSTAQEFVDWLRFRGNLSAAEHASDICLEINFREAFKWHRLQGRLDRLPFLATLAELWGLRQHVKELARPVVAKAKVEEEPFGA